MALDSDTLDLVLRTLRDFASRELPLDRRLDFDAREEFPLDVIRGLLSPEVGLHLVFIPEEYGGLGGGAYDIYRVSEAMAQIDLGIATSMLAIALGTDPIRVGGTEEQREKWMGRIASEGLIVAYGVTEPGAGSEVAALKTKAEPIYEGNTLVSYRLNGTKQFITNGGVADLYTILARAPEGPSFFVVEAGTAGLEPGKAEDKHGIRASNTSQVILEDVVVPKENLLGLTEGEGLLQASKVFAFTRLMVAAFGLGGGEAALKKAIEYGNERTQFGSFLCEKQGYTHKLLVPHSVRLAAARAFIEEVAHRIDSGEEDLATEGAMAKLLATEAGNAAAEAAIQAHGGYGYVKEYEVEKIKRDVRITMIYEGTSEILQGLIALTRWRQALQSKGRIYLDIAEEMQNLDTTSRVGGSAVAAAARLVAAAIPEVRKRRLTRQQYVQFLLADAFVFVEAGAALARKAHTEMGKNGDTTLAAKSRLFGRSIGREILDRLLVAFSGSAVTPTDLAQITMTQDGALEDMDLIAVTMRTN